MRGFIANTDDSLLSFTNLVEIHVLSSIRRVLRVSLPRVRQALQYLGEHFQSPHPLARLPLQTDGVDLFLEIWGQLIAISGSQGQVGMRQVVDQEFLDRFTIDQDVHFDTLDIEIEWAFDATSEAEAYEFGLVSH